MFFDRAECLHRAAPTAADWLASRFSGPDVGLMAVRAVEPEPEPSFKVNLHGR